MVNAAIEMDLKTFLNKLKSALPAECDVNEIICLEEAQMASGKLDYARLRAVLAGRLDFDGYMLKYPDVCGQDPIDHFLRYGINENRKITPCKKADMAKEEKLTRTQGVNEKILPLVSVLVPVYNNAEYLSECFDSIINQTLKNIEIIIIDDGSSDSEAIALIDAYVARDGRIRLIRKPNSGYGHSMNVGMDAARGQYLAIVESDDCLEINALQKMYEAAARHDLDFVKTDYERFYGSRDRRFVKAEVFKDKSKYNIILDPRQDGGRLYDIVNVIWNALYKMEFLRLNKIRFNESPGAAYQDNGFFFQTYMHARRIMLLDISTYRLRRDNPGSSFYNREKIYAIWREYNFIYNKLKENEELYKRYIKIFQYKKFINFLYFTLAHIEKRHEDEIIELHRKDFLEADRKGEIDKKIFGNAHAKLVELLNVNYQNIRFSRPEVSIILSVYNKERYLRETLDSILNQTFKNFELVVVDDESQDGSCGILNEYAAKDNRIKLFRQKNQGPGGARNTGLKNAAGDYVVILDADDVVHPKFVESLLRGIKKHDADFCVCESESFNEITKTTKKIDYALTWRMLPKKDCFSPKEINGNIFKAFCGWAWDKIYKRSFIVEKGILFPNLSFSEDLVFVYACLACARRIATVGQILIKHRHFVANSVSNTRHKHPLIFVQSLEYLRNYLIKNKIYIDFERDFLSYTIHHFNWNINNLQGLPTTILAKAKKDFINKFSLDCHDPEYYFDVNEVQTFYGI